LILHDGDMEEILDHYLFSYLLVISELSSIKWCFYCCHCDNLASMW